MSEGIISNSNFSSGSSSGNCRTLISVWSHASSSSSGTVSGSYTFPDGISTVKYAYVIFTGYLYRQDGFSGSDMYESLLICGGAHSMFVQNEDLDYALDAVITLNYSSISFSVSKSRFGSKTGPISFDCIIFY